MIRSRRSSVRRPRGRRRALVEWLRQLFYAGVFFYFFNTFAYQSFLVHGSSMEPLLHDGERIFVNRYLYRFFPIERGDIVVLWYPLKPDSTLVKRIIGLPGDRVSIQSGTVHLNGRPLEEPYIPPQNRTTDNFPAVIVPPAHYFVLGDERRRSNDSRRFGFVPKLYIIGKVSLRFWPLERFGWVPPGVGPVVAE